MFGRGYILDIGPQFFLIALVSDGIRSNGFQRRRLADIRKLRVPDKFARFHEAVLKKRRIRFPKKPFVDVSSLGRLLRTADRAFPLITIHREKIDAGGCWVGRVVDLLRGGTKRDFSVAQTDTFAGSEGEKKKHRSASVEMTCFCGDAERFLCFGRNDRFLRERWLNLFFGLATQIFPAMITGSI